MSWEKTDANVTFYCDSPECDATQILNIAATREEYPNDALPDFVVCWRRAQLKFGWRSFKYRNWEYFCSKCGPAAEVAHVEHQRQEEERERIKAYNAR